MVTCRTCQYFTADTIGDGDGIGRCQVFEAYLLNVPGPREIGAALVKLGNAWDKSVFWGGSPENETRDCQKFET